MNKLRFSFLLFLAAAACSDKSLYPDAVKAFDKHSYREYPPGKVREILETRGFAGLAALDSRALVVKAKRRVRQMPAGERVSSGLLAIYRDGAVHVAKVFQNSPAAAAGLKDGDKIIEIDGLKASPQVVAQRMDDSFGFNLKVEQGLSKGGVPVTAQVKRGEFYFPLIFGFYEPDTRTGYVKIGLFVQGSSAAVISGIKALAGLGARKIIFDLRDNKGGMPEEAAGLLGAFAPVAGPVLELKSRHKGYCRLFEARSRGKFSGIQTAVIVNGATSMAAEAFAQALKELAGARIVGGPTMGNVSLVRTFRLGRGHKGLELTVARIFPPSGLDLEGNGVVADIKVELTEERGNDLREAWEASSETALLGDLSYAKALEVFIK